LKTRAYVNFALIKYWGKKNEKFKLPFQSSLSFTVDKLFTETSVIYDKNLKEDIILINNKKDFKKEKRVRNFMNFIRKKYMIKSFAYINSTNFVPTAAGLASSSSAFAALSYAATKAAGINLDKKELSKLARQGSGSASRSIYDGFAIWKKGNNKTSFAKPLNINWEDFRIIVCLIDENEKKFSSSIAMKKTVENKKIFKKWVSGSKKDLKEMLAVLPEKNIDKVGIIAERNAELMHKTIEATGIKFKNKQTIEIINKIFELRKENIKLYYTMDAGPNIKILTIESQVKKILFKLKNVKTIVCKKGFGVSIID